MNKRKYAYLVYQKDFAEKGNDKYFLYVNGEFSEVEASDVVSLDSFVVTHDFWLIANSLYKKRGILPKKVIDVVLLSKIVAGIKSIEGDTQPWDINKTIKPLYEDTAFFDEYLKIYYRRERLDEDVYILFSQKLAEYSELLFDNAIKAGEYERFFTLELPVYNELISSACKGIRVSKQTISDHKKRLKLDFYRELKKFADKHNVLYEVPSEGDISEKLKQLGYDVENYSLEFLIDFLPSKDGYTDDLNHLKKISTNFRIFNSIPSSNSRITPIVESHWTSTARIYHKSPSIQNIAKGYRNIFIADECFNLCYVDYDQFEVGIMAALSGDPKLKDIYENSDAYEDLAEEIFSDSSYRKKAKIIFLSYTYGMSEKNLMTSVTQFGGNKSKAREYFSEFVVFKEWKKSVWEEFENNGRIATICANYFNRHKNGELSEKERRTAVSHAVQGSATYIFKKALLELSQLDGVYILIPMHDAVLFQHTPKINPEAAIKIFEDNMTTALGGKVKGKASIEEFYAP